MAKIASHQPKKWQWLWRNSLQPDIQKTHSIFWFSATTLGRFPFEIYRISKSGPFWSKDDKASRHTYNARTETVASKPSYREPWKKRRYALVPMAAFYEPDYETGKALRWKIERHDKRAFTVAAIWDFWKQPTGEGLHSFSMLTINADDHPVMGRFHAPSDEKRSLVIVPPERREAWLEATPEEAKGFLVPMPAGEFTASPSPRATKVTGPKPDGG